MTLCSQPRILSASGPWQLPTDAVLFKVALSDSSTQNRASPLLFSATVARVLRTDSPW